MHHDLVSRYTSFLKQALPLPRFQHSLGVMQVMQALTPIYSLDLEKATLAGLLHDAGKCLAPEQQRQIVEEAGIPINEPAEQNYELYLHGPVGAYFVCKELGVTDMVILDAIRMHTFVGGGDAFDSPLVWCLRFSDLLEPNRRWDDAPSMREGSPRLREAVFAGKLAEGAFIHVDMLLKFFTERGYPVHSNLRRIKNPPEIKEYL